MPDVLVRRFEQYFGHPDNDHDVLNVGDRGVACSTLRQALEMLGVDLRSGKPATADTFDETLREAVRIFQSKLRSPGLRRSCGARNTRASRVRAPASVLSVDICTVAPSRGLESSLRVH
jgi:hypothetical protein